VHYNFMIWLQYALLGVALFALVKGVIVFCATVILSWLTIVLYERIPFGLRLISNPSQVAATQKLPSLYARLRQLVSQ